MTSRHPLRAVGIVTVITPPEPIVSAVGPFAAVTVPMDERWRLSAPALRQRLSALAPRMVDVDGRGGPGAATELVSILRRMLGPALRFS
mgnify:CR=1 FL=1